MKNIFQVHSITYLVLLGVFICGYYNYFLIISFILLFHDLGHIIIIKLFKYKISKIIILPFGSNIETNISSNIKSLHLFLISSIGIIMQLFLYPVAYLLHQYMFINNLSYEIFLFYNKLIIIFNLLPILPLDGSKILLSFIENITSYKLALKLINLTSILFIISLLITLPLNINLILITGYLLTKVIIDYKNRLFTYHKFLLDRYFSIVKNKKAKYINSINKIYKNRYNFINNEAEDKVLRNYYQIT